MVIRFIITIIVEITIRVLSLPSPPAKEILSRVVQQVGQTYLPPLLSLETEKKLHYRQILKEHEEAKKPIKHRKKIPKYITCPHCGAPYQYIYNYGPTRKSRKRRFKCKICEYQFIANASKKHPTLFCPHCHHRLDFKRKRKDFEVFRCINPDCLHKKRYGNRYTARWALFSLDELAQGLQLKSKINLSRAHSSYVTIAIVLTMYVVYGLSSRQVARFMRDFFRISISHQTVLNWVESAAALLLPLLNSPLQPLSDLWIVDETYERYKGRWGYFLTVLDGKNHAIISQLFSETRSSTAALAVLLRASLKVTSLPSTITIISDGYVAYPIAISLLSAYFVPLLNFKHLKVIGLKPHEYRREKNIIERYYGTFDPRAARMRGFGSLHGATTFSIMFTIYYNYLRPHQASDNHPPILIDALDFNDPVACWQILLSYALNTS
jgi:putative transposase